MEKSRNTYCHFHQRGLTSLTDAHQAQITSQTLTDQQKPFLLLMMYASNAGSDSLLDWLVSSHRAAGEKTARLTTA